MFLNLSTNDILLQGVEPRLIGCLEAALASTH